MDKPHETVPSRDTSGGIQHNLCALAAQERANKPGFSVITQPKNGVAENCNQIRIRNLRGEIPDKDTIFSAELMGLLGGIWVKWNIGGS